MSYAVNVAATERVSRVIRQLAPLIGTSGCSTIDEPEAESLRSLAVKTCRYRRQRFREVNK
jgi:hypothetical protein